MHHPKLGEKVRIVADTTGHGIPLGVVVSIGHRHPEHSDAYWVQQDVGSQFPCWVRTCDIERRPDASR